MPRIAFAADMESGHVHLLDFELDAARDVNGQNNTVADPARPGGLRKTTDLAGDHDRTVSGGDIETRPVNVYVHWIIRFR
jgi:hypothetical protein